MIIQLPYVIKSEARRQQAEQRRKDIERQLSGSKYGIAYTDGTEKITQLNRSLENNLMKQIEYLTSMLYSQLGITQSILDGTADEKTMLKYYNRTIEPIISAIVDEMKRKFLTKTARSQNKSIMFFRDPFKLVPVADLAEISDKFTRTVANSCSTMHKIAAKEFTMDDFSCEHIHIRQSTDVLKETIDALNVFRDVYLNGGILSYENGNQRCYGKNDKEIWWQMIQLLPSSYNQTRNVMMNYEVLANIYKSRKDHKLDEWRNFCKWIEELPYSELIAGKTKEN